MAGPEKPGQTAAGLVERKKENVAICPTDSEAVVPQRKKVDKQSFDYVWRSGVAGGFAGCAAKTVVAPLDRVKILFQANNPQFIKYSGSWAGTARAMMDIYGHEGAMGLYRGHSATLLRVFPYAAIKFLAGALAGATSVFFTYPLEVIRVRLAFETKRDSRSTLASICKRIYNEQPLPKKPKTKLHNAPATVRAIATTAEATVDTAVPRSGLTNFYRGFTPTILGMLPYAGMSFLTHDTMGDLLRHPLVAEWTTLPQREDAPAGKAAPLRSWAELFAGGTAGLISQTCSYPLEVIRRRMQVGGAVGDGHRLRISETAALIMKERGFRGFFVGLTIGYVKVFPMAAAAFYTYERSKTWFGI
ncbi:putative mitochondrial carrier protein leu5 protein [Phaeoacremonium minimum UCRPA7]|uniref:Mitochondrial thiamine pyrophosphate carrier 1 n=1 Tax=Phaeoacremonium minimum (strain UCR-PA7) TaxID=1286976 RepID=R8BWN4_PHAM7|nr:putative mitochondrial carrier protein leu5 protein [Phaeoacremonium minimum UCRPA7]EOO03781.1 putative mitochondrial carrier protein leu5 protein [Phaeoacremonium minimum UCRPA7]